MSVVDDLKPVHKALVMDLLDDAGFDVSDWNNYKGKSPAANPKYCYNWSFEQPGEAIAVCLWHRDLKLRNGKVAFHRKPRAWVSDHKTPGSTVVGIRNAEFGARLELAYRQQLPVRVIVIEGKQRNPADPKPRASVVQARMLDKTPWAVGEHNYETGECWLIRGERPAVPAVEASDTELSWFEGRQRLAFVFHRRREARARRAKISEALARNGGRLICEVPNCRFDFMERYSTLGEGYAQVHHLLPLSKSTPKGRETRLEDLAIVCANCHAMIHVGGKCRPLVDLISAR